MLQIDSLVEQVAAGVGLVPLDELLPEWLADSPVLVAMLLFLWYMAGERASRKDERDAFTTALRDQRTAFATERAAFTSALSEQRTAFAEAIREQRLSHVEEGRAFMLSIDALRRAIENPGREPFPAQPDDGQ